MGSDLYPVHCTQDKSSNKVGEKVSERNKVFIDNCQIAQNSGIMLTLFRPDHMRLSVMCQLHSRA